MKLHKPELQKTPNKKERIFVSGRRVKTKEMETKIKMKMSMVMVIRILMKQRCHVKKSAFTLH